MNDDIETEVGQIVVSLQKIVECNKQREIRDDKIFSELEKLSYVFDSFEEKKETMSKEDLIAFIENIENKILYIYGL
jgi:predicted KAP-like P-loop ATPase